MENFSVNIHFQMNSSQDPPQGSSAQGARPVERAGPAAPEKTQQPPSAQKVEEAAAEMRARYQVQVELGADENTGRPVARIMSPDGERLLRQIPPEKLLALAEAARAGKGDGLLNSVV